MFLHEEDEAQEVGVHADGPLDDLTLHALVEVTDCPVHALNVSEFANFVQPLSHGKGDARPLTGRVRPCWRVIPVAGWEVGGAPNRANPVGFHAPMVAFGAGFALLTVGKWWGGTETAHQTSRNLLTGLGFRFC